MDDEINAAETAAMDALRHLASDRVELSREDREDGCLTRDGSNAASRHEVPRAQVRLNKALDECIRGGLIEQVWHEPALLSDLRLSPQLEQEYYQYDEDALNGSRETILYTPGHVALTAEGEALLAVMGIQDRSAFGAPADREHPAGSWSSRLKSGERT